MCKYGDQKSVTYRDNEHISFFSTMTYKPSKVDQGDLILACDQSSLVGLCTQDYKSLCAAVTILAPQLTASVLVK